MPETRVREGDDDVQHLRPSHELSTALTELETVLTTEFGFAFAAACMAEIEAALVAHIVESETA